MTCLTPKQMLVNGCLGVPFLKKCTINLKTHWQEIKGAAEVIFPETQRAHQIVIDPFCNYTVGALNNAF